MIPKTKDLSVGFKNNFMKNRSDEMKINMGPKDIMFPNPVFIVGTYGEDYKPNAMNVAWAGICSSNPPCVMIAIREQRCTYKNIMNRKAFTVNIPSAKYAKEADYFGLVSGNKVDKFNELGLTAIQSENVDAPYIEEFGFNAECKLIETLQVGQHTLFIGQIMDIKVEKECIGEDGKIDIQKINPLIYDNASISYYAVGEAVGNAFSLGKELLSIDKK